MKGIEFATIFVMLGLTYLLFQAFGPRRRTLLYSKEDKTEWDALIGTRLGSWFTITNIVGTLTSLATVYVFFIGSSKLFGLWTFLCSVTIWAGGFVTNWFTRRITALPHVEAKLDSPDQSGGVIASIFWSPESAGRTTAALIKWISLVNIAGVIWLEFSLFADISATLAGISSLWVKTFFLAIICVAVFYFTLRYGLRGFVFADLFHSPAILIGSVLLLAGAAFVWLQNKQTWPSINVLTQPVLPLSACLLFAVHVLFLNSLLVATTEAHWLRVWIFRLKETTLQLPATTFTAGIWALLIAVGFIASTVGSGAVGEDAISALLKKLSGYSFGFVAAFWIGAVAALFSTADTELYSFLVVREFDTRTGTLRTRLMETLQPALYTVAGTVTFCGAYLVVRWLKLPVEKIVFTLIPVSLNTFPALMRAARNLPPKPAYTIAAILTYTMFVVFGFLQPEAELRWTLAAALMPVIIGGITLAERPALTEAAA